MVFKSYDDYQNYNAMLNEKNKTRECKISVGYSEELDSKGLVDAYCWTHDCHWKAKKSNLLKQKSCKVAKPKTPCLSNESFDEKFNDVKNKYKALATIEIIGPYDKMAEMINCYCTQCHLKAGDKYRINRTSKEKIWKPTPHSLLYGHGCPRCSRGLGKRKEFIEKLDEFNKDTNSQIQIDEENNFVSMSEQTYFRCNKCGHIWPSTPRNILKTKGCPKCGTNRRTSYTQEEFEAMVLKKDTHIKITGTFVNMQTPVSAHCEICGSDFPIIPNNYIRKKEQHWCPNCVKKDRLLRASAEFKMSLDKFNKCNGTELSLCENQSYVGETFLIRFHCGHCKQDFVSTPRKVISLNGGCKFCKTHFRGEKITYTTLNKLLDKDYYIKKQMKIDAPNIIGLRFDFVLIDANGENLLDGKCNDIEVLKKRNIVIVEFDGNQHFTPTIFKNHETAVKTFREENSDCTMSDKEIISHLKKENWKQIHTSDIKKNRFALQHNIPLLRIRFDQENQIEELIKEFFGNISYYQSSDCCKYNRDMTYDTYYDLKRKK